MKEDRRSHEPLTLRAVVQGMATLSVFFKDRRPDEDEMEQITKFLLLSLVEKKATETEFNQTIKTLIETKDWFPTIHQFLEALTHIRVKAAETRPRLSDIEWKRNFPETCSPEEALMLGISEESVARAKRNHLPEAHSLKKQLKLIGSRR